MSEELSWNELEDHLRIGLLLQADAVRDIVGGDRGLEAAATLLGYENPSDAAALFADRIYDNFNKCLDREALDSVKLEDTQFRRSALLCFDTARDQGFLNDVDTDHVMHDGILFMEYFLSAIPDFHYAGNDYTGLFRDREAPLLRMVKFASARVSLAEFVQRLADSQPMDFAVGFTPVEIAALGGLNIRSVRNAIGTRENSPIKSRQHPKGDRADYIVGNPLDAVEWLAGRNGFTPGVLDTAWVEEKIASIGSVECLAALVSIHSALRKRSPDTLAKDLGWSSEIMRAWTRGRGVDVENSKDVAAAVGLSPDIVSAAVGRFAEGI